MKNIILIFFFVLNTGSELDILSADKVRRIVKVGAFSYYPAIFQDTDGQIKGFFVDMLNEMGRLENWDMEYVYGSWNEGLQRIQSGEVDILVNVAYTDERAQFMDYPKTHLFTIWSQIYVNENSEITDLLDLQGKSAAVLKGDFNAKAFSHLINSFHIQCKIIELDSFDQIFTAVTEEHADCGSVMR